MLVNKRLDLDIAKTRLRKAHEAEAEARVRGPQLLWFHIWAQITPKTSSVSIQFVAGICSSVISLSYWLWSVMHLLRPVRTWTPTRWEMTTFPISPSCSVSSVLNGLRYVSLALNETKIHTNKYIGVHWNKLWLDRGIFSIRIFTRKNLDYFFIYSSTKIHSNTVHKM